MAPRLRLTALGIFAVSLAVFSVARMRLVSLRAEGPAQARFLAGDEPSYLLLAHSAAFDLDFNLFNNRTAGDGRFFGMPRCEGHGARKDWELEQEKNLCYVATTRAIEELILCQAETK